MNFKNVHIFNKEAAISRGLTVRSNWRSIPCLWFVVAKNLICFDEVKFAMTWNKLKKNYSTTLQSKIQRVFKGRKSVCYNGDTLQICFIHIFYDSNREKCHLSPYVFHNRVFLTIILAGVLFIVNGAYIVYCGRAQHSESPKKQFKCNIAYNLNVHEVTSFLFIHASPMR